MLEVGGLVALHDYSRTFPGVIWAVQRFLKENLNYNIVAEADSLVVLKKTAPSLLPEVGKIDRIVAEIIEVSFHWRRSIVKRFHGDTAVPKLRQLSKPAK